MLNHRKYLSAIISLSSAADTIAHTRKTFLHEYVNKPKLQMSHKSWLLNAAPTVKHHTFTLSSFWTLP